jgi:hypothetical protein
VKESRRRKKHEEGETSEKEGKRDEKYEGEIRENQERTLERYKEILM